MTDPEKPMTARSLAALHEQEWQGHIARLRAALDLAEQAAAACGTLARCSKAEWPDLWRARNEAGRKAADAMRAVGRDWR